MIMKQQHPAIQWDLESRKALGQKACTAASKYTEESSAKVCNTRRHYVYGNGDLVSGN